MARWRSAASARGRKAAGSCPRMRTSPRSGRMSVPIIMSSVVLPAPLGPVIAVMVPRGRSRSIPRSTGTSA